MVEMAGHTTEKSLCLWHLDAKGFKYYVQPCAGDQYAAWKADFHALYYCVDDTMTEERWELEWEKLVKQTESWPSADTPAIIEQAYKKAKADGHTVQGKQGPSNYACRSHSCLYPHVLLCSLHDSRVGNQKGV